MINHEEMIPKGEFSEEMPSGLQALYVYADSGFEEGEKITEDSLKQLIRKIRKGERLGVYLFWDSNLEGDYMQIEISHGLIALQYVENDGTEDACFYSSFNPDYLDSDEESPMVPSDGQSVILTKYTMHDFKLAAKCIEYFARTGKLYPGMEWLKG